MPRVLFGLPAQREGKVPVLVCAPASTRSYMSRGGGGGGAERRTLNPSLWSGPERGVRLRPAELGCLEAAVLPVGSRALSCRLLAVVPSAERAEILHAVVPVAGLVAVVNLISWTLAPSAVVQLGRTPVPIYALALSTQELPVARQFRPTCRGRPGQGATPLLSTPDWPKANRLSYSLPWMGRQAHQRATR